MEDVSGTNNDDGNMSDALVTTTAFRNSGDRGLVRRSKADARSARIVRISRHRALATELSQGCTAVIVSTVPFCSISLLTPDSLTACLSFPSIFFLHAVSLKKESPSLLEVYFERGCRQSSGCGPRDIRSRFLHRLKMTKNSPPSCIARASEGGKGRKKTGRGRYFSPINN